MFFPEKIKETHGPEILAIERKGNSNSGCHYDCCHNGNRVHMGEWKQYSMTCLNMNMDPDTDKIMLVFYRLSIYNELVTGWGIKSFQIMGDGVRLNGSGVLI